MSFTSSVYDWNVLKSVNSKFLATLKIIAVSQGYNEDCALLVTRSGELYAIGKSSKGCLCLEDVTEIEEPCQIKGVSEVVGVSVCGTYGDALAFTKEGKVYVWGNNTSVKGTSRKIPTVITSLLDIVDARCVDGHYLALSKHGKVYEWRGVECCMAQLSITPNLQKNSEVIVAIVCGRYHSLALTENGDVYQWGYALRSWKKPMCKVSIPEETVAKVACNYYQNLVLTKTGKIFTWGCNNYGLGDPSGNTQLETPVQLGKEISRFVDIGMNTRNACGAVTDTGSLYIWEENNTPTPSGYKELHQVISSCNSARFSWTYEEASRSTTNDSCASTSGKVCKRQDEDEDLAYQNKMFLRLKREHDTLEKNYGKRLGDLEEELDKLKALLVQSEVTAQENEKKLQNVKQLEKLRTVEHAKSQEIFEKLTSIEIEHTTQKQVLEKLEKYNQQEQFEKLTIVEPGMLQEELKTLKTVEVKQQKEIEKLRAIESEHAKLQAELEKLRMGEVEHAKLQELDKLRAVEHEKLQADMQKLKKEKQNQQEELEWLRSIVLHQKVYKRQEINEDPTYQNEILMRLENDHENLKKEHVKLEKGHDKLEKDHDKLQKDYAKMKIDIAKVEKELAQLEKDYEKRFENLEVKLDDYSDY